MASGALATTADTNNAAEPDDEELVRRVLGGELSKFETLMRRYNRRLYRIARAITGDAAAAEDAMQDAYLQAFRRLSTFEGRARWSTWLTTIAVHAAIARRRQDRRYLPLTVEEDEA